MKGVDSFLLSYLSIFMQGYDFTYANDRSYILDMPTRKPSLHGQFFDKSFGFSIIGLSIECCLMAEGYGLGFLELGYSWVAIGPSYWELREGEGKEPDSRNNGGWAFSFF